MRQPSPQLAVSVTVVASRTQRWLALAFATLLAALAVATESGRLGPLQWPHLTALILTSGNLALIHTATNSRTARPLDVSGLGSLRGTVQQDAGQALERLQLLPGSTLWPWLLVLRLGSAGGRRTTLLVWPDSVPRGQFRPLSVALRTLAARGTGDGRQHRIPPGRNIGIELLPAADLLKQGRAHAPSHGDASDDRT